jgi:hypothetical protein
MTLCNIHNTVNAVGVTSVPEDDRMELKHVGQVCKCCNAKTLEYSALVG